MKDGYLFALIGIDSLPQILNVGLIGYSTDFKPIGGTTTVHLFLANGLIVKIYSEMHDIDSWNEVGSLIFELVDECPQLLFISLATEWKTIKSLNKLVLDREEFTADSGIILESITGETIMIITSANVDTLAVEAPLSCDEFLPENDLSSYSRRLIE